MEQLILEDTIRDLIRIPSVSNDIRTCNQILKHAQIILGVRGVTSKIINGASSPILIWGQLELNQSRWLLNSHLDVVPGTKKQFVPRITKDKIWGRGSADTKWASAILLNLPNNLVEEAVSKKLTFSLVVDEEVGGASTKVLLDMMKGLQGAIFLEPTQEKIVLEAKGIMQVKISAQGRACHGSRPWDGENAIEKIMRGLATFRFRHPAQLVETKHTTFNFSQVVGGIAINQVPDQAELFCDIRYNPKDNPKEVVHILQQSFLDSQVEALKIESPIKCEQNALVVKKLVGAMKENSLNPLFGFDHGSSDARHGTNLGIPSLVFGIKGKGLHSEVEWGSIKSIRKVSSVLSTWISLL